MELVAAIAMALGFTLTNGFHDASNAIAILVATRVARPAQAVIMASFFNLLGPLLVGAAVADTIAGIVILPASESIAVLGAALTGATAWNLITWRLGLPSSSGHALGGGLTGAAVVVGGLDAVNWGGLDGWRPVGVFGVLIALAVSPVLGVVVGDVGDRVSRRLVRRATRRAESVVRGGTWVSSATLAFSHGANDAQKAIGVIVALLVADGRLSSLTAPLWVKVACGATLTLGTALGGWPIVRTVGQRIFRMHPLDGLVAQGSSTAVILGSSLVGAPVSTTQVVSSSVVGIGLGRRRIRHIHWRIVREMLTAWLFTLPASALAAILVLPIWLWLTP